jgi:hypothetical protein
MVRYQRPVLNLNADDVWGAACAAQRINGSYLKEILGDAIGETNRQIVARCLADTTLITEADREQATVVRRYYKALTFKILQGKNLNEFDNNAMVIANRDIITGNYDVAVITSLPGCYVRASARDGVTRRVEQATGGYVGAIGSKVALDIEVIKSNYSQQWGVYFNTGVTSDDKVVFFSFKNPMTIGSKLTVAGTVKAHRDNCTQLNRVKSSYKET